MALWILTTGWHLHPVGQSQVQEVIEFLSFERVIDFFSTNLLSFLLRLNWPCSYWYTGNKLSLYLPRKEVILESVQQPFLVELRNMVSHYSINSPEILWSFCLWGWGMHDSSLSGPAMQTSRLTHWEIVWKITNYLITYDNPGLSPLSGFSDGPRHIWRSWRSSHLLWSQIFSSQIHLIPYPDILMPTMAIMFNFMSTAGAFVTHQFMYF